MLSDKELDETKARVEAVGNSQWQSWVEGRNHTSGSNFIMTFEEGKRGKDIEILGVTQAEQDFIAHAKQDITRLLAEIEQLKQIDDMDETAYLLSSPKNAQRLRESIAQAKAGKIVQHDLIEVD